MSTATHQALIRQMNELEVKTGQLAIWGLGQMGVALKGAGSGIVYIDPVLTNVVVERVPETAAFFQRAFPAPLLPEEITNASLVLCTHEHLDHTDPLTLGPIAQASPRARFVASAWAGSALDEADILSERREYPQVGQQLDFGAVKVTGVAAAHEKVETNPVMGNRFFSFHLQFDGVSFFHSGDTVMHPAYISQIKQAGGVDVAFLAANGRDARRDSYNITGNLQPVEAVWLAQEIGADLLIGGHNDLFTWNTVRQGGLADAVQQVNPRQKFCTLQPGQLLFYIR